MRILIDADGCPVVDISVALAKKYAVSCYILCDTSHHFQKSGAETLTFSKGSDSVDFALVNLVQPGDIVVTQDYGLAAMCLAKKCIPIHHDGMLYTADNMESLLESRHTARKVRMAGGRLKGPAKRTKEQDMQFAASMEQAICRSQASESEISPKHP